MSAQPNTETLLLFRGERPKLSVETLPGGGGVTTTMYAVVDGESLVVSAMGADEFETLVECEHKWNAEVKRRDLSSPAPRQPEDRQDAPGTTEADSDRDKGTATVAASQAVRPGEGEGWRVRKGARGYRWIETETGEFVTHDMTPEQAERIVTAVNSQGALIAALTYPRYGDTATLLEKAADLIDAYRDSGGESYLTPHLRRAAAEMRSALSLASARGDARSGAQGGAGPDGVSDCTPPAAAERGTAGESPSQAVRPGLDGEGL